MYTISYINDMLKNWILVIVVKLHLTYLEINSRAVVIVHFYLKNLNV